MKRRERTKADEDVQEVDNIEDILEDVEICLSKEL